MAILSILSIEKEKKASARPVWFTAEISADSFLLIILFSRCSDSDHFSIGEFAEVL